MAKKSLPLAVLVEDMAVYPRHAVDDAHVNQLAEALRAGAVLPPVVADAKSKRVVDGWHRLRAYRKVLGAEGVVDVDLRHYPDEAALLLEAISLNAAHGRRLDRADQVRSALLAEQAGVEDDRIAVALRVTRERVATLKIRVAIAPSAASGGVSDEDGKVRVALKRPAIHFAGREMTADQVRAHDSMPGTSFLLVAHQLRDAMRFDLMNRTDERLIAALRELRQEIEKYLAPLPEAA